MSTVKFFDSLMRIIFFVTFRANMVQVLSNNSTYPLERKNSQRGFAFCALSVGCRAIGCVFLHYPSATPLKKRQYKMQL